MIKARKKDIDNLLQIENELTHGLALLMSNRFALMVKTNMQSSDVFKSTYYPDDTYSIINKQIGNELVPMFTAISKLSKLLKDGAN